MYVIVPAASTVLSTLAVFESIPLLLFLISIPPATEVELAPRASEVIAASVVTVLVKSPVSEFCTLIPAAFAVESTPEAVPVISTDGPPSLIRLETAPVLAAKAEPEPMINNTAAIAIVDFFILFTPNS